MNRQIRNANRDLAWAERELSNLYFEAAQARLWREKELADLEVARQSEIAQLKAARDFQLDRVAHLSVARLRDAEVLASVRQELSSAQDRIAVLSNTLEAV